MTEEEEHVEKYLKNVIEESNGLEYKKNFFDWCETIDECVELLKAEINFLKVAKDLNFKCRGNGEGWIEWTHPKYKPKEEEENEP